MMTASSTEFINALMTQTGGFIQDLFPLLGLALGVVIALVVYKIIVKAFLGAGRKLFK